MWRRGAVIAIVAAVVMAWSVSAQRPLDAALSLSPVRLEVRAQADRVLIDLKI
jgi:hypothetical protein